jgi:HK97 family phage prohead protease
MSDIEYRAATVAAVSYPKRLVSMVVMPYERESDQAEYQGRMIREVFARGAFDGVERRARKVHLNRDHDPHRLVGQAVEFHSDDDSLRAECRIGRTPLGDETLALAADDLLDASAGFAVMKETWQPGPVRRILKAFLAHIALVPDPAYPDARVLAVRAAPDQPAGALERPPTPNLDQVRAWRLEAAYDALSRSPTRVP